jgi:hypothetical protein
VFSLKILSDVPADQPTWLLLLKVEHRGPSLVQISSVVSEKKIFSKVYRRKTKDAK